MAPKAPRSRDDFEIALICALPIEAELAQAAFDTFWDNEGRQYNKAHGDKNEYTTGTIGEYNVVLAHMPGMGKVKAVTVALNLEKSFPAIKLVVVLGICGGSPFNTDGREIVLGDVVISHTLIQYDFGRQYPKAFERKDTIESGHNHSSHEIRSFLAKIQTARVHQSIENDTCTHLEAVQRKLPAARYLGADADQLYESSYVHKHHVPLDGGFCNTCSNPDEICQRAHKQSCSDLQCDQTKLVPRQRLAERKKPSIMTPRIHFGCVGSADTVMKSGETRDRLAQADQIVAFEMEGAGVWEYFPSIVVKGVCDYADSHKNKEWQTYAAATAACCVKAMLKQKTPEDRLLRQAVVSETIWHVPFDHLTDLFGRYNEIEKLEQKLLRAQGYQKVAVAGLGGVGKTRLAWEIASRARSADTLCSVFWVQASTTASMEKDIRDIAVKLQIPGHQDEKSDHKLLVKQYLSQETAGKWLLIIDNADDESIWCPSIPANGTLHMEYMPKSRAGSVLITTRSQKVAACLAGRDVIRLQQFGDQEAQEMLQGLVKSELSSDTNAASELVSQLSYLPLAIVQAAAYMNMNDLSINDYLQILRDMKEDEIIDLLSDDFYDEIGYQGVRSSVASTWLISFTQIGNREPEAMNYLSFMSCLNEKNIPASLLPEAASKKRFSEIMGVLTGYSFVQKQAHDYSSASLYSLHRLVRLATRNWLRNQDKILYWTNIATDRLASLFPLGYDDPKTSALYMPHAQTLCDFDHKVDAFSRYELLTKIRTWMSWSGQLSKASEFGYILVTWSTEKYGETHDRTMRAYLSLGIALRTQGNWIEAEEYLKIAAGNLPKSTDIGDYTTLECLGQLASVYYFQGRLAEADVLQSEVVQNSKTVLGIEHPQTLGPMADLALTYHSQGRHVEAEKLGTEVHEVRKRVLGVEHPNTLASMANLASTYAKQGRLEEAEKLRLEVLEARKRVFGVDHPDTLTDISNLAPIYIVQGRLEEAEKLGVEILEIKKRVLGADHPDTLVSMANLASTYARQERLAEAERLGTEVLEVKKRVLGVEHPHTLTSMGNLALIYFRQGRYEEAEKLEVEVLEVSKRVLGVEHPETLSTMANLAWTCHRSGDDIRACALMASCTELSEKRLGSDHLDTINRRQWIRMWRALLAEGLIGHDGPAPPAARF